MPVTRRGKILPLSVTNLRSKSGFLSSSASMAISIRRRGMARFARRKFDRRLAVFGSIILLYFAMQCMAPQERVVFFLFEPSWGVQALFVTGGDIARNRFSLGLGLGAFQDNDVSRHNYSLFSEAGS